MYIGTRELIGDSRLNLKATIPNLAVKTKEVTLAMDDSQKSLSYLVAVESFAEDILSNKQSLVQLDKRRNETREALRALRKQFNINIVPDDVIASPSSAEKYDDSGKENEGLQTEEANDLRKSYTENINDLESINKQDGAINKNQRTHKDVNFVNVDNKAVFKGIEVINNDMVIAPKRNLDKKCWMSIGSNLVKCPVRKALELMEKDQKEVENEIEKLRDGLRKQVNKLRDLEMKPPVAGLLLKPLSNKETTALGTKEGWV